MHIAIQDLTPTGELCTFPAWTTRTNIGSYPAGQYKVSLYLRYRDFFSYVQEIDLVDAAFQVSAPTAAPVPVPARQPPGLLLLTFLVLAVLWRGLNKRSETAKQGSEWTISARDVLEKATLIRVSRISRLRPSLLDHDVADPSSRSVADFRGEPISALFTHA